MSPHNKIPSSGLDFGPVQSQLSTCMNGKGDFIGLDLRIPDKNLSLVSLSNLIFRGGLGEITIWPECEEFASVSSQRIGELFGPATSNSKIRHPRLTRLKASDLPEILSEIRDAYSETNGLPFSGDPSSGPPKSNLKVIRGGPWNYCCTCDTGSDRRYWLWQRLSWA